MNVLKQNFAAELEEQQTYVYIAIKHGAKRTANNVRTTRQAT